MPRLNTLCAFASILVVVPAGIAASGSGTPGTWRKLRPAPFAVPQQTASVWTGRQLIVFGRRPIKNTSVEAAESYDPARDAWSRLSPPAAPQWSPGYRAVWTGKEMLVFGAVHSVAFNPVTGKWRELRHSVPGGITVWTDREAIGWGGGCCGDADSNGAAYNPATNTFRRLARSPLAPEQQPWTGRALLVWGGLRGAPTGTTIPKYRADGAAFTPATP